MDTLTERVVFVGPMLVGDIRCMSGVNRWRRWLLHGCGVEKQQEGCEPRHTWALKAGQGARALSHGS